MPHLHPNMSIGERITIWRVYRGLTQEACAGLCGKSLSWWKKVEQGVRHVEKLSDLIAIAQVLRIKDLSDLTGVFQLSLSHDAKTGHPALAAVRRALVSYDIVGDQPEEPAAPSTITDRNAEVWRVWHEEPRFYSRTGELLPGLITDATLAHRYAADSDRRAAARALSETYHLARQWLRKVGEYQLSWIAADRGMTAAQEADDPYLIAASAWNVVALYNAMGRAEEAQAVALDGIAMLEPLLPDGSEDHLAMWGSLQLYASISTARCGDPGTAWRMWDAADQAARRLGPQYCHPWTIFGQTNVGAYAVGIPVELGKASEAVRAAERLDAAHLQSVERRARYLVDVARGYVGRRDDVAALHVLLQAEGESPEEVAHNLIVHEIVREMLRRDRKTITHELRGLAGRVGVVHA
ncbi:MAG TPA: helix-turn-helix domain-containing protein [Mycobacteriales bacterium]|nr:helix-turn-helix domain-containing protein [Mycobacteriales bacterium]